MNDVSKKKIEPTDAMVEDALFQRAWMTPNTTRTVLRAALNHPDGTRARRAGAREDGTPRFVKVREEEK